MHSAESSASRSARQFLLFAVLPGASLFAKYEAASQGGRADEVGGRYILPSERLRGFGCSTNSDT